MCLSELFGRLQDTNKSAMYASKAYNLCRTLHVNELNSRYHRAALLQMATALRKQGELGDAHDYCSVSNFPLILQYTIIFSSFFIAFLPSPPAEYGLPRLPAPPPSRATNRASISVVFRLIL